MKKIFTILLALSTLSISFAAVHTVSTQGLSFIPSTLTINIGDTVVFNCFNGFHNVNGSINTFPSNPDGFINPQGVSSNWTYAKVFTIAGFYNYQCDPHIPGMVGSILVQNTTDCNGDLNGSAFLDSCGNCVGGNTGAVACISFSPTVLVSLSNTDCDSLSDLTISVSQDPNEPDMLSSLFTSNLGSFDISNMLVGNIIGSAVMSVNGGANTFNTNLKVTTIISSSEVVIQSQDINTGLVLGSFNIQNTAFGVAVSTQTIPDGNNVTGGNSQTVIFSNVFVNPGPSSLVFNTTIDSELGHQDVQIFPFSIVCACPTIAFSTNIIDATCFGNADGSIFVNPTGGTPPYSFLWSNGQSTQAANGLVAGIYSCTVTDANGCFGITPPIVINEPTQITSTTNINNVTCFGLANGSASVIVNGGVPPYTFQWLPSNLTSPAISGLSAGTYSCNVSDANGCLYSEVVTILQPTPLTVTSSSTPVGCSVAASGTATVFPSGGTLPYTYFWSPSGATTNTVTGLTVGTYSYTVTDANSCIVSGSSSVSSASSLNLAYSINYPICNGANDGSITTTIVSGTPPYTYSWENLANPGVSISINSSIDSLLAGSYTLLVSDSLGCTFSDTIVIIEPGPLSSNPTFLSNIYCNASCDGSLTVNPIGGCAPYSYVWNLTSSSSIVATTQTVSGLCAGIYEVITTDCNGCTSIDTILLSEPPPLYTTFTTTDVTCNGYSDGTANVIVSGGTVPYTYQWSNGGIFQSVSGLIAGNYTFTVIDMNNCTQMTTVIITEPDILTVIVNSTDETSLLNDGSVDAVAIGGTPPYNYTWNNGGVVSTQVNLPPGLYTVDVVDANGCLVSDSVSINAYIPTGSINIDNTDRNLIRISDVLGKEVPYVEKVPLFYIYDDGTVERRIVIE